MSRRSVEYRRKLGQSNLVSWKKGNQIIDVQAGGDIEKLLPRKHAHGSGKTGAGTWHGLDQKPENTKGKVRGEGKVCTEPVSPEKEAKIRNYMSPKR